MKDYKEITIERSGDNLVVASNPKRYPLIGQGRQGIVFRLSSNVCVKVYADEAEAQIEGDSYKRIGCSPIVPKLYKAGKSYIVMEYIDGLNLKDYLIAKGNLSRATAHHILSLFNEMRRLGFTRMDLSLRHILVTKNKNLKIIDHFHAFTIYTQYPSKFFTELKEIGMLSQFLRKVSEIDNEMYQYWKKGLPEFFIDIKQ